MDKIESITFKRIKGAVLAEKLKRGKSFLLLGPRQTGKTTLLEQTFEGLPKENQLRYDLSLPSQREVLEDDPEVLVRTIEAKKTSKPVYLFIDEIQKAPKIMDVLQYLLDRKKIILAASGSSARKMRSLGTNWLPGRIHLEHLYPLTWEESGLLLQPSLMEKHLRYGFLPGILSQSDSKTIEEDLTSYTHLYLEEEIRREAVVRNLPRFTKFLRLAALESGSTPNYSKIGSQVELSHTMVREYFRILEDTLIIHSLPPFGTGRNTVLRASKYYFFDIGVRNAAAQIGHSEGMLNLQMGTLFEHLIVLELVAQWKDNAGLYHWRTKQGGEVDLILERKTKLTAIEIKASKKPSENNFAGLAAFCKKHRQAEGILICQVPHSQKFGDFLAVPWQKANQHLA